MVGAEEDLLEIPGVDEEFNRLSKLFGDLEKTGRIELTAIPTAEATWEVVVERLESKEYHVFHYAGHSYFNERSSANSSIFLRGYDNQPRPLTASDLESLFQNSQLRFAYFSCCESAVQGNLSQLRRNDFLGIMDATVKAGVPAVLGMRWPVDDEGAKEMAVEFYKQLFNEKYGYLDVALFKARNKVSRLKLKTWLSSVLIVQES